MTFARPPLTPLRFLQTTLVVSVWIHLSEVARYFLLVMPELRRSLVGVPDVAPMTPVVFAVWALWDTLLAAGCVALYALWVSRFGSGRRSPLYAGTLVWLLFFVLFWVGMVNMNLSSVTLAAVALPLAWIEMVVGCAIARGWLAGTWRGTTPTAVSTS